MIDPKLEKVTEPTPKESLQNWAEVGCALCVVVITYSDSMKGCVVTNA